MTAQDDLPFESETSFGPLESPYSGVLAAVARVREGMAMLDKYVSAIERDALALSRPAPRPEAPRGKAWRQR